MPKIPDRYFTSRLPLTLTYTAFQLLEMGRYDVSQMGCFVSGLLCKGEKLSHHVRGGAVASREPSQGGSWKIFITQGDCG